MIRSINKSDVPNLMPLLSEIYNSHQKEVPYVMKPLTSTKILEDRLYKMIAEGGYFQFIYEQGGKIVGYMDMSIHEEHLDLLFPSIPIIVMDTLIVDQDYRGTDVALSLIEHAKSFAKEQGFNSLQLYALTAFPHLTEYYSRYGFKKTAYQMWCEL